MKREVPFDPRTTSGHEAAAMTTLDRILEGTPLDESTWIEVGDFCAWLSVERHWVASLVEAGVLEPRGAAPECLVVPCE